VIYLAVIVYLLSACYPVSNHLLPQNEEDSTLSTETPIAEPTNTPNHQETDKPKESPEKDEKTDVSNRGLTAELKGVDMDPDWPTITLCADLPTIADWMPRFSAVYRGEKIPVVGWRLLDPTNTASKMKNRCYDANLSTDIFASGPPSGTLLFSLDYWEASTPENSPIQLTPNIVNGPWVFAVELPEK
jgi:hypothetical protein